MFLSRDYALPSILVYLANLGRLALMACCSERLRCAKAFLRTMGAGLPLGSFLTGATCLRRCAADSWVGKESRGGVRVDNERL